MRRYKGAFTVTAEPPSVVTTAQAVLINKSELEAHAAMDALVVPYVALIVCTAPENAFFAKKLRR